MRLAGLIAANVWMYCALGLATGLFLIAFVPVAGLAGLCGMAIKRPVMKGIWVYGRVCVLLASPVVKIRVNDPGALCGIDAAIVVYNHQSFYDTYLFGAQDAFAVSMLVKSWPFRRLFFFRPFMRYAGYIETELATPDHVLARCRAELDAGVHLFAFPEGTRSADGTLGRFHSGIFLLATQTGARIVPAVIHGSGRVLPKNSLVFRPGRVDIEFLPPVNPALFADAQLPHGALRRHVRKLMADCLERKN